ncbi:MAG TPA: c-type cytochrome [Blastocatellia bacterium]|nr:c-type cytochrome [Blastocatellia bacterium]
MNLSTTVGLRLGPVLLWALLAAQAGAQAPAAESPQPFNQERKLEELRQKIADQKDKPAEEVFKNIRQLKGMPAARLLRVMEVGYSKSLGVDCAHCHVVDQWEKDDKPAKQVARDMADMARAINGELLKSIRNLKGPSPAVNCTTCHRGQLKPALNMG